MVRACLIIIVFGAIIGAMMPSRLRIDSASSVGSGSPSSMATPPRSDSYRASTSNSSTGPGPGATLDRGPDGHFYADAEVNGVTVHFLVDTGATGVALTTEDAQRVGLPFFLGEFTTVGRGASGDVRGKHVTLDRVSLGGKSVEQVDGAIIEGGDRSLLGQSFLRRMDAIEMTGDHMVIR